jgi:hypothetical protein
MKSSVSPTNRFLIAKSLKAPRLEALLASQRQEGFEHSLVHPMTTVPNTATTQPHDNSRFMEDLDADMDVDPLGAPIKASSPSAFPPDEQPARNTPLVSHGNLPQNTIPVAF